MMEIFFFFFKNFHNKCQNGIKENIEKLIRQFCHPHNGIKKVSLVKLENCMNAVEHFDIASSYLIYNFFFLQ